MKTFLTTLTVACVLAACSTASARVVVHAGPVHVSVGRAVVRRPVRYVRPVARPVVVRPVVVAPTFVPGAVLTPYQRYLRRQAILDAIQ